MGWLIGWLNILGECGSGRVIVVRPPRIPPNALHRSDRGSLIYRVRSLQHDLGCRNYWKGGVISPYMIVVTNFECRTATSLLPKLVKTISLCLRHSY
jgi:hypothetical protein